jgi:hypothetical protein
MPDRAGTRNACPQLLTATGLASWGARSGYRTALPSEAVDRRKLRLQLGGKVEVMLAMFRLRPDVEFSQTSKMTAIIATARSSLT